MNRSSGVSADGSEERPEFNLLKFRNRRFIHAPDAGNNLIPVQKKNTVSRKNVGIMLMSTLCFAANMAKRVATVIAVRERKNILLEICLYSSRSIYNWGFVRGQ